VSCVCFSDQFSSTFIARSGVPQGSVLGPLLFNIFINDLCEVINHSSCLLYADDLKVYRAVKSPADCILLHSDIDQVYEWCSENFMKPNLSKIRVISLMRKGYEYRLGNSVILHAVCIKDLGIYFDSKLYFHQLVNYLFSHALKLLELIRTITFSFSTLDSLLMLYFALVRSKLEYAFVVWNSVTNTDSNKLEHIQRKFAALCHSRFFRDMEYYYINILDMNNLRSLHTRHHHIDALFLICIFKGVKNGPILETVGICVLSKHT
jgi:hypothetical protein